jgi:hypothetical protein
MVNRKYPAENMFGSVNHPICNIYGIMGVLPSGN